VDLHSPIMRAMNEKLRANYLGSGDRVKLPERFEGNPKVIKRGTKLFLNSPNIGFNQWEAVHVVGRCPNGAGGWNYVIRTMGDGSEDTYLVDQALVEAAGFKSEDWAFEQMRSK
jgi:hypothetical protein